MVFTVGVGSGVNVAAMNFPAMNCACSMELFFLKGIFPFLILDFESRKIFWRFLVFLTPL